MQKKRIHGRLAAILIAVILSLAISPAALADTGDTTPKITQQPDQLVLQLGVRWAGVEFRLRTDAGSFPVPVVVDESGVLTMDLGGSSTYTLSCIESAVPIPDPPEDTDADGDMAQSASNLPAPSQPAARQDNPAPVQSGLPIWPLVIFLMGLAAAGGGLVAMQIPKRRQQADYDEWNDEMDM